MSKLTTRLAIAMIAACFIASDRGESRSSIAPPASFQTESPKAAMIALQANSLCAKAEHVIFSCQTRGAARHASQSPGKIVSLCASLDLDRERGYLQYRYGLPGKIELEFPESRKGTQQVFHYSHYFRYQFDLTAINFNVDGYEYSIFDDYNGEEKPAIATQGVSVTAPGKAKEVSFVCRTKPKADYSTLQDVLPRKQE
jgi:hypothetical protein